jgi:hypothetical protein
LAGDIKRMLEHCQLVMSAKPTTMPALRSVEVLPPLSSASTLKTYTASLKLVEGPWLALPCRTRLIVDVAEQFPARVVES